MKVRFPLFAKVVLWFFLNLALLAAGFFLLFGAQFRLGMDSLLAGRAGERVRALSETIAGDLEHRPRADWDAVLERFGRAYGMRVALFRRDGTQAAGEQLALPPEVAAKVVERSGPGGGFGRGGSPPGHGPGPHAGQGPGSGPGRFRAAIADAAQPRFLLRSGQPRRYWVGVCVPLFEPDQRWPLTLLLAAPSLGAGGLLFDSTPWLVAGFGAVLLSVAFWIPLVRHVTRAVSQLTSAAEDIADGRFAVRVDADRADELGRLGQAVNRMAERLGHFVTGQKRFLGDIAHELGSPLARLEMALGVLEDRAGATAGAEIGDAREEVEHLSRLVHELLSFARAGLNQAVNLQTIELAGVVRAVVEREAAPGSAIEQRIDPALAVRADPGLLSRALANLVRNAVRYAAAGGPVTIEAGRRGAQAVIRVADQGPGVPADLLQRVFDPFFRAEGSRSRDTGGAGLGLAIVKTCVEACGGTVAARNRDPHGFEVEIALEAAE